MSRSKFLRWFCVFRMGDVAQYDSSRGIRSLFICIYVFLLVFLLLSRYAVSALPFLRGTYFPPPVICSTSIPRAVFLRILAYLSVFCSPQNIRPISTGYRLPCSRVDCLSSRGSFSVRLALFRRAFNTTLYPHPP